MGRLADGAEFVVTIVRMAYEAKIRYPAAALAYYAFVSFVPLLLLVFAVVGDRFVAELAELGPQFLTPQTQELVNESLRTASGRAGAGVLAVLVLLWSSGNLVGDIRTVIQRIEGTRSGELDELVRDALVIFGSLVGAFLAILSTSALVMLPPRGPFFGIPGAVVLVATLAAAFVPLYWLPSDLVTAPRAALPGALTTAVGWTGIHVLILFYANHASQYAIYGVLSGVIIILTSLYAAAVILLTGIIVNAELATRPAHGLE